MYDKGVTCNFKKKTKKQKVTTDWDGQDPHVCVF